jgi:hypothetical protein
MLAQGGGQPSADALTDPPIDEGTETRSGWEKVEMGVRFMNLKPEDRKRIKKFIERF